KKERRDLTVATLPVVTLAVVTLPVSFIGASHVCGIAASCLFSHEGGTNRHVVKAFPAFREHQRPLPARNQPFQIWPKNHGCANSSECSVLALEKCRAMADTLNQSLCLQELVPCVGCLQLPRSCTALCL